MGVSLASVSVAQQIRIRHIKGVGALAMFEFWFMLSSSFIFYTLHMLNNVVNEIFIIYCFLMCCRGI